MSSAVYCISREEALRTTTYSVVIDKLSSFSSGLSLACGESGSSAGSFPPPNSLINHDVGRDSSGFPFATLSAALDFLAMPATCASFKSPDHTIKVLSLVLLVTLHDGVVFVIVVEKANSTCMCHATAVGRHDA
jgi:hypothetical protein